MKKNQLLSLLILVFISTLAVAQVNENKPATDAEPATEENVDTPKDSVAVAEQEEEPEKIKDPCYLAVYAIVRSYDSKDNIWIQNTKILAKQPLALSKPEGGSCEDLYKEIQKDFVEKVREKYGKKYSLSRKSVKIEPHTVYGHAQGFLDRIRTDSKAKREKYHDLTYSFDSGN